jgi:hypothetical protein
VGIFKRLPRPFDPFRRYRQGNEPPEPLTLPASLPSVFKGNPSLLAGLPDFLTVSLIPPQLSGVEPFLPPFRLTTIQNQFHLSLQA